MCGGMTSLSQRFICMCGLLCRLTTYHLWREGNLVRCALFALPALHLTDTPEGMDVANVSNKAFPIVSTMVPASELALPHADHPPRTESAMRQVSLHPLLQYAPEKSPFCGTF